MIRTCLRTAVVAVALTGALAACASSDPEATAPETTTMAVPGSIEVHEGPRELLDGFEEVTVTVTAPDGTTREWCLLLAATPEARERGLMFVTDPALGGYDGMLFAFDADVNGGFWMKNTRLPLSIAYVRADGTTTATTDMVPCPDEAATCPSYPAGGSYRHAIEVPQGQLARLGISDRSKVSVGATSCAPAPARP